MWKSAVKDKLAPLVNGKKPDMYYTVDVRSDTLSMPSQDMREAMACAIVGDDVYGEDPTVNELERRSAEVLDKEASLFVPSGTMANLLAVMVHCSRRGAEAIAGDLSHVFLYEQAAAAQIGGVQVATVPNRPDGTFCLEAMERKIRSQDLHEPITSLVIVENTHNMCGGKVLPLEWLAQLATLCKRHSLRLHMDGARVFNAAEALRVPVASIVKDCDSVCFCLSKGLSAPVGSILAGSKDFIKEARRLRKALGGGMRQAGILAAAGLVALETVVPRLAEDHEKVQNIAQVIDKIQSPNIKVDIDNVQTNILLIEMASGKIRANDFATRLGTVTEKELQEGITDPEGRGIVVKVSSRDWSFARIVLYQQITQVDVQLAIKKLIFVIREFDDLLR